MSKKDAGYKIASLHNINFRDFLIYRYGDYNLFGTHDAYLHLGLAALNNPSFPRDYNLTLQKLVDHVSTDPYYVPASAKFSDGNTVVTAVRTLFREYELWRTTLADMHAKDLARSHSCVESGVD